MTLVNIIGPRCSGKSTYVTSLAGWGKQKENDRAVKIIAKNEQAKKLSELWEYIVLESICLSPTGFHSDDFNDRYLFEVTIDKKNILRSNESIEIDIVDNPGEIFQDIGISISINDTLNFLSRFYQNIINNLRADSSLLIIMPCDRLDLDLDRECARKIDILLTDIFNKDFNNKFFKIALVFSKCDRSYTWLNRNIKGQTIKEYSKVMSILEKWSSTKKFSYKSFLISTFGGLSSDPSVRNSIKKHNHNHLYVLRDPSQWKPYGLIAPLYWLSTGKDLKGIDCY
jgi:energy-coupling factor transporter ATP-binding protein EcfA2